MPEDGRLEHTGYMAYLQPNRATGRAIAEHGDPVGAVVSLSLPLTDRTFDPALFRNRNVVLNLHGSDGNGTVYWGEERREDRKDPMTCVDAMTIDQAVAPGSVILGGPCYGAMIFAERADGTIVRRTSDDCIALRFLRNGARAYIGCTRIAYSAWRDTPEPLGITYGLWGKLFIQHTRAGHPPARAFMLAKRDYAASLKSWLPYQFKMYHQVVYLGLPLVRLPAGRERSAPADLDAIVAAMDAVRTALRREDRTALRRLLAPDLEDVEEVVDDLGWNDRDLGRRRWSLVRENLRDWILGMKRRGEVVTVAVRTTHRRGIVHDGSGIPGGPSVDLPAFELLEFRRKDGRLLLSGLEAWVEELGAKVVEPHVAWILEHEVRDEAASRRRYETLYDRFLESYLKRWWLPGH